MNSEPMTQTNDEPTWLTEIREFYTAGNGPTEGPFQHHHENVRRLLAHIDARGAEPQHARPPASEREALHSAWVVWSYEHDAWWASERRGYVSSLLLAGVYIEAEAKEIERDANRYRRKKSEEARPLLAAIEAEHVAWRKHGHDAGSVLLAAALAASPPDATPSLEEGDCLNCGNPRNHHRVVGGVTLCSNADGSALLGTEYRAFRASAPEAG